MAFIRKIFSFLVMVVSVVAIVSFCMSTTGKDIIDAFVAAVNPFDFMSLMSAVYDACIRLGTPLLLFLVSLIGLTMPAKPAK